MRTHKTGVVVAGGGLAGMVAALELLDAGEDVLIIDKDVKENFGGLARESFGGVHLIDTPQQRRLGLRDTPDLALSDWLRCANFGNLDANPRLWAEFYCHNSLEYIYHFLVSKGIRFLPLVNWTERGLHRPGNSVPRWHIAWGTGFEITDRLANALNRHPRRGHLDLWFEHEVSGFNLSNGEVRGVYGSYGSDKASFIVDAEHVVIASGGICGGDLSVLRRNWYRPWGPPPEVILNGAHQFADGMLLDQAASQAGANLTHLDRQWHYASGVHHPANRRPNDGLSLVPPRSALWFNGEGARIMNPGPLVGYTDTRHLVDSVLHQPGGYSWQILNWKIAIKELAVSGCDYMTAFRYKNRLGLVQNLLFGNKELVRRLLRECPEDFITAETLGELADKMTSASLFGLKVDADRLKADVKAYDDQIDRGKSFFNDAQLRHILNFRSYRGDRIRICNFQKIDDPKARPLIAIREFILSRKSLGGIETDIDGRVLDSAGAPIKGLYAAGEAAGFGGGGIHGTGSLEGTFLGSCILNGQVVGRTIARGG
ncbi:FAD-binding protein [Bacteroidota bacterium]